MNNATDEDYLREEAQMDIKNNPCIGIKSEVSTGCWIDGHWGIYGLTRLIEIASNEYGFVISDDDAVALDVYRNGGDEFELDEELHYASEWVMDLSDDAEQWLNDTVARPGYSFGWHSGEFFYQPISWWAEED